MMTFNLLIAANDYNFGAQMTEKPSRFLAYQHKSICLAFAGIFLQKALCIENSFCL